MIRFSWVLSRFQPHPHLPPLRLQSIGRLSLQQTPPVLFHKHFWLEQCISDGPPDSVFRRLGGKGPRPTSPEFADETPPNVMR